jgi:hypothetical protein
MSASRHCPELVILRAKVRVPGRFVEFYTLRRAEYCWHVPAKTLGFSEYSCKPRPRKTPQNIKLDGAFGNVLNSVEN